MEKRLEAGTQDRRNQGSMARSPAHTGFASRRKSCCKRGDHPCARGTRLAGDAGSLQPYSGRGQEGSDFGSGISRILEGDLKFGSRFRRGKRVFCKQGTKLGTVWKRRKAVVV